MARLSLSALQPLGRALMLPIAVLPIAGLLLRLGQDDMLGAWTLTAAAAPFIGAAGSAIFDNLGLLFAIGVAVGFAKDGNGAAALAGAVCFLVSTKGAEALMTVPAHELAGFTGKAVALASTAFKDGVIRKLSAPLGILAGLIAGGAYNRFGEIKLPEYLAFFGGRRFVPIVSGLAGLVVAFVVGVSWTSLSDWIDGASRAIVAAGPLGLFVFGVLNRLLIVTGLHHILNNIAWFVLGDFHGATGDLHRFFAGDPSAGAFMSGFFPVMMFGLPAACLAMYHTARPERRKAVGGMLLSLALTAMLTGVTEPIEFTFMFLAPVLYGLHAVMTGLAMVIMDALKVRLGFSFSAGLFDYWLNFGKATKPLLLIPVGLAYFALYYGVFRFAITRFNLKTPGREPEAELAAADAVNANPTTGGRPQAFITALGGPANLISVDACTTRLRLVMADQAAVNEPALKALGARGLIRPSPKDLQVVMGPIADQLAREIRNALGSASAVTAAPVASAAADPTPTERTLAAAILAALGGPSNLLAVEGASNRLLVSLANTADIDEAAVGALGLRGLTRTSGDRAQLLLAGPAGGTARALGAMLPVPS